MRRCGVEIAALLDGKVVLDRTVYYVVGVKTCLDAELKNVVTMKRKIGGNVDVALAAALLATTGIPFPDIINPGEDVSTETTKKASTKQTAKGERLFALQYGRVKYRRDWFCEPEMVVRELHQVGVGRGLYGGRTGEDGVVDEEKTESEEEEDEEDGADGLQTLELGARLLTDVALGSTLVAGIASSQQALSI